MRSRLIATAALIAAFQAWGQQAGGGVRYKWVDEHGLPHYSDSLSADALRFGYDVISDQGGVVRHVDRPPTAQERAEQQRQAAAQAAARRAAEAERRNELQLLAAYPTEASFRRAQKDRLDSIDQEIETTRINLRNQEKTLADLLARAGDLEHAKQPVPAALSDRIAEQRNVVATQRDALQRVQEARAAAERQAAVDLARYRALQAAQAPAEAASAGHP